MMTFQVRLKMTRKPNQPRLRFDFEKLRNPDVGTNRYKQYKQTKHEYNIYSVNKSIAYPHPSLAGTYIAKAD